MGPFIFPVIYDGARIMARQQTKKDGFHWGIDFAKNVFQIHGTDQDVKSVLKKRLARLEFVRFMANSWSRTFLAFDSNVPRMGP